MKSVVREEGGGGRYKGINNHKALLKFAYIREGEAFVFNFFSFFFLKYMVTFIAHSRGVTFIDREECYLKKKKREKNRKLFGINYFKY